MVVLSLFDGMSCGQQALHRLSKKNKYYASEVDPYAISVTRFNFPNTIFLGDVREIEEKDLPYVDLLIGGSPCQNFSFAGKQKGMRTKENIIIESLDHYLELKEKDFEFEGQSYLFWEYVRILSILKKKNPKIKFLLENVKMKIEFKTIFDTVLCNNGVLLNSSNFSAQNRERYYWTNIVDLKNVKFTKKNINIKDIIFKNTKEDDVHHGKCVRKKIPRENAICCHIANASDIKGNESIKRVYDILRKAPTLTTMQGGHREPKIYLGHNRYRKLTIVEMERLQTVSDGYTAIGIDSKNIEKSISNNQRKKMIGNGWTVNVIQFIFSFL